MGVACIPFFVGLGESLGIRQGVMGDVQYASEPPRKVPPLDASPWNFRVRAKF